MKSLNPEWRRGWPVCFPMSEVLRCAVGLGLGLFVLSIAIGFVRLWRGPSMADRIVALDMMTSALIGFCGLFVILSGVTTWTDIALALALVSFVSVVAFARYAERLARRSDTDD